MSREECVHLLQGDPRAREINLPNSPLSTRCMIRGQDMAMACCVDCPKRYLMVFLGFIGLLVSIGFRTCFALVMVHVTNHTSAKRDADTLFPNCTATGTSRNLQLHIDPSRVFLFYTAFYCGTLVTQIPGGILAARYSSKWVCGLSILVSSVLFLVLPTAIQYNLPAVYVIRVLQGLAEGCSVPALNGVISEWAPKTERSRMITIAYAGAYISPAIALITTGACACYVSWSSSIYIYGGCGVVWSLVWMVCVYDNPRHHPSLGERERGLFQTDHSFNNSTDGEADIIPWRGILTSLPVYAIIVGAFCRNWISAVLLTQQPQYFKDVYHMTTAKIGFLSAVPHVLMTMVVIPGGFLVDNVISRGICSITVARRLSETLGFGLEAASLMAIAFVGDWKKAFGLFCAGVGFSGFAISGYQVNPLDLAPKYASVVTGLSRLGMLGSILSTLIAYFARDVVTNADVATAWKRLFIIAASIHFGGVIFYAVFASGQRQPWSGSPSTLSVSIPQPVANDDDVDDETTRLLRRRLRHRRPHLLDADSYEYGSTTRFFNTI
ncbi:vesicular glutamate transporter 3-like isoform X1 [Haliotis rufescens]|uniref:vesicular glutamate transporter 3-like isoform X1 n=2 Tax=Haliotis rufescens TaxID=6454 RepID=UPI00201F5610|nr:vesicular glutamate transporter 3-like isoform X1 [Haliotis rufescens]